MVFSQFFNDDIIRISSRNQFSNINCMHIVYWKIHKTISKLRRLKLSNNVFCLIEKKGQKKAKHGRKVSWLDNWP